MFQLSTLGLFMSPGAENSGPGRRSAANARYDELGDRHFRFFVSSMLPRVCVGCFLGV